MLYYYIKKDPYGGFVREAEQSAFVSGGNYGKA